MGSPDGWPWQMGDGVGRGRNDGGTGGTGEFGVTCQWARERKLWGLRETREAIDLVMALDADPCSNNRRGRRFECGYWNTTRGVNETEV